MTKKLSAVDRQRVSNALTKCAAATKDIETNEELADKAYQILSKELGDNPGLFKAACQVYNSCKSIHKLSAADDNTRGNSFSILNVQDMSSRLTADKAKTIRKAASAPAMFSKVVKPVEGEVLQKVASVQECKVDTATPKVDNNDYRQFLIAELEDTEAFLYKSATAVRNASRRFESALDSFISALATEPREIRKEAAARLYANYGEPAAVLLDCFSKKRPLQKLAAADYKGKFKGTPHLPGSGLFKRAQAALEAKQELDARTKLHSEVLASSANMVLDHCRSYYGLGKKAAGLAELVVKTEALKDLASFFGGGEEDMDYAKKVFNSQFINNMLAHSHRRSFMRAAMNDALAKYPLSELVPAYNKAIATLPANTRLLPATANQSLIESIMMKDLATGSTPSKADIELISTLANTVGKYRVQDGQIAGASIQ